MRFLRHPFFERDVIGIVDHIVEVTDGDVAAASRRLVLQLRIIACFSMCDGGGDLMLASPSRPVPYEGGGEYGARQKA